MLEDIKKLKEEAASSMGFLRVVHSTSGQEPYDRMMELIDRAVRIASEHHLKKVEEAVGFPASHRDINSVAALAASRQAHEELTGEKVKTE